MQSLPGLRRGPVAVKSARLRRNVLVGQRRQPWGSGDSRWQQREEVRPQASASSAWGGEEQSEKPLVFPRLKEKDVYRVLGVPPEADFEEVQDARNYLVQTYRTHEPSREHIEWAFESILDEKLEKRQKHGFKPARRAGKRQGEDGWAPPPTLVERIRNLFEATISIPSIVNEGSIFAALGIWAATYPVNEDPMVPLISGMLYMAYKMFTKRTGRTPDGPWLLGAPVVGVTLVTMLSMFLGVFLGGAMRSMLTPWAHAIAAGNFVLIATFGFFVICVK